MPDTCDVVVLLSGTGSNLQALIDSDDVKASPANIRCGDLQPQQTPTACNAPKTRVSTPAPWITRRSRVARPSMQHLIEVIDAFKPQAGGPRRFHAHSQR
jgi:phosphoribosylglycinamide formyltransferase 1